MLRIPYTFPSGGKQCQIFVLFLYVIQHCFICCPSDFTVSERRMLGSNPGLLRLWLICDHVAKEMFYLYSDSESYNFSVVMYRYEVHPKSN